MRDQDELLCLGFGGARFNVVSQYYPTAGMVLRINGVQVHVDPGPAAILYMQLAQINPEDTRVIFASHDHTDHVVDVPVMIEAMHKGDMRTKVGMLVSTEDYSRQLRAFYRNLLARIVSLQPGESCTIQGEPDFTMTATLAVHDEHVPTIGAKFYAGDYCIGFTADTEVFPQFVPTYKDCDILVCNILRPESYHCDRHVTTNEILPYLEELRQNQRLKAVVITHLGARWGSDHFPSIIVEEVKRMKDRLKCPVFPAAFGLKTRIKDLLDGHEPPYSVHSIREKMIEFLKNARYFQDSAD